MSSLRTQVYLTPDQRAGIQRVVEREHTSLAEVIRAALDAYLASHATPELESALAATFGALPDLEIPSRDEWQRGPDPD